MYNHYVFESVDFLVLHTMIASFVPIALFLSYKMNIFNKEIEVGTITLISVTFSLSHAAILVLHDALYLKAIRFHIFRNIRGVIYENEFRETLLGPFLTVCKIRIMIVYPIVRITLDRSITTVLR
ncbi:hypothetical protein C1646_710444 [Rhizophagus diaphanus]|nr:hypothetical protein C1646_710444 [Rhizophagus diaphanus] [Rhizophagus sp. MUCL 43196]